MKAPSQDFMASGVSANATNTSTVKDLSSQEMLRTSVFWNMFILFIFASTAGIMMVGSLSTIAQTQLSITALEASNLVAINALANLVGRLAIGRFPTIDSFKIRYEVSRYELWDYVFRLCDWFFSWSANCG